MSVLIGHASIDERGKIAGGAAGDQTGKEICIRTWYGNSWDYVLRCKSSIIAEIMAVTCEKICNNNHIGYNQNKRNTLRTQAIAKRYKVEDINTNCDCDCSSLMAVCAECAGVSIPYVGNNAPTTSTMEKAFTSTGYFEAKNEAKYTMASCNLKRGDILVKRGHHTVMVLTDGKPDIPAKNVGKYRKNSVYTTTANLYIRQEPYGAKMKHNNITVNAMQHSHHDEYGYAILDKGTRVTCLDVKVLTDSTWILIPSGWICAINKEKTYIE